MEIREIKKEELDAVLELTREAYKAPYQDNGRVSGVHEPDDICEKVERGEVRILVLLVDDKIIGAARFRLDEDSAYIYRLVVSREFRRQGFGLELMRAVESVVKKEGINICKLDCMQEKGLVPYYERLGYVVKDIKPHLDHHDVFMTKIN